jgi:hypothetical protein
MHYKGQERAISPYLASGMKYGRGPPPGVNAIKLFTAVIYEFW